MYGPIYSSCLTENKVHVSYKDQPISGMHSIKDDVLTNKRPAATYWTIRGSNFVGKLNFFPQNRPD